MGNLSQDANTGPENAGAQDGAERPANAGCAFTAHPVSSFGLLALSGLPSRSESGIPSPPPSDASTARHEARAVAIWQHLRALKR